MQTTEASKTVLGEFDEVESSVEEEVTANLKADEVELASEK